MDPVSSTLENHCVIVTCFSEDQPGYLDFSYRIKSLAQQYKLTILSQDKLTQSELMVPGGNYLALGRSHGKLGWLSYLWKCATYIRKHKPDVAVLLHSSASPISLLIHDVPACLYWNEHPTNLIHFPKSISLIKYLLVKACHKFIYLGARYSDLIMPIGEEHLEDLRQHGIDSHKIKMIYMGVSDEFLANGDIKQLEKNQPIKLIYLGTVSKPRGRDVMLDAMAILATSDKAIHLTIIGASNEQLDYCNHRIHELGLSASVTVIGRVSGELMPSYLAKADIGICLWEKNPWYEFNPPTKLFEYLAAGLPVLASNIRTHTRYIQDWNNGLIFEYDKVSLANAVASLSKHKNRIQILKINAKAAGQQYSWSKLEPIFLQSVNFLVSARTSIK